MPVTVARIVRLPVNPARAVLCCSFAALLILAGSESLQNATANGDTRTISFHHTHTKEDLTVTYKKNGRYDEEALKRINWALRDWRTDQPIKMNPHLIDIVWEVYREVGGKEPVTIISAYRSPATNAMLRRRSRGVAKHSQHMLGNAMDFYIPNVSLEEIRHAGLRLQRGGVGFYPSSGSPFVHLDTGSVRHWPRMPEQQLARVLAKGPLTRVASADQPTTTGLLPNPFAKLFGGGRDEDEDNETAATPSAPASRGRAVASKADAAAEKPAVVAAAVPMPRSRPGATAGLKPGTKPAATFELASETSKPAAGFQLASATSNPVELRPASQASLVARASTSANDVINTRGFWEGSPEPTAAHQTSVARSSNAPRPPADIPAAASAEPQATGTVAPAVAPWPMPERSGRTVATAGVLAYAPALTTTPSARPAPMGTGPVRATTAPPPGTTVAVKRSGDRPSTIVAAPPASGKPGAPSNNPWMRAMILSPSAQNFMSTSLIGVTDFRQLAPYLHKPPVSVMMTFSADPHLGMSADRFRGSAVVFVSTVTFNQRTAWLR